MLVGELVSGSCNLAIFSVLIICQFFQYSMLRGGGSTLFLHMALSDCTVLMEAPLIGSVVATDVSFKIVTASLVGFMN